MNARYLILIAYLLYIPIASTQAQAGELDTSGWGTMIAVTSNIGPKDRIISAELDGAGLVRVSGDSNVSTRLMLEYHIVTKSDYLKNYIDGSGPFVAIQPGSDGKIIQAVALGWMMGFKDVFTKSGETTKGKALTLSVGIVVDPNTKVLGDGIEKNKALPAGDTLRYKTTTRYGLLLGAGFTF